MVECSSAILLAGGLGERYGGERPKQMAALTGEPLVLRSLRVLDEHEQITSIVLVAHPDWIDELGAIAADARLHTPLAVVRGGATRNGSALRGLAEVSADETRVLLHDAARPMLSAELVTRTLAGLEGADAVLPVIETIDLLARVEGDVVTGFEDRASIRRGQTPQVFRTSILRTALVQAETSGRDHPTLYEAVLDAHPAAVIRAVPGDVRNRKLTVPIDRLVLEVLASDDPDLGE